MHATADGPQKKKNQDFDNFNFDFFFFFLAHLSERLMVSFCDRSMSAVRPSTISKSFIGMILGWLPFKIVQRIEFHTELWLPWQPKGKN